MQSSSTNLLSLAEDATQFLIVGDHTAALIAVEAALLQFPFYAAFHEIKVECLLAVNDSEGYLNALRDWQNSTPWLSDPCFRLAAYCHLGGEVAQARSWMDQGLSRIENSSSSRKLPYGTVTFARLYHDQLQLRHLTEINVLPKSTFAPVIEEYAACIERWYPRRDDREKVIELPTDHLLNMAPFYRRCIHLYDEQVPTEVVRGSIDFKIVAEQLAERGYAVIDDFLDASALGELRRYLVESTIWHNDAQKGRSYIGAYKDTGANSRIANKAALLLRSKLHLGPLEQVWAYKNVFGTRAIGTHADFAAINVNFWMTPDEHCRDGGGIVIYNKRAPSDWSFEEYNSNEIRIAEYLNDAKREHIDYRFNRAIVFDSSLFHSSAPCVFDDTYEGLRINVTFLFGTGPGMA